LIRKGGVRLLTLTGPSGVGKARFAIQLAQELASDFSDGGAYVALATVRDAALVPSTSAQVLRIHEMPASQTRDQVTAFLQEKHLVLVLDNLEQVLDCSPFVASLLAHCPRLTILATSRSALRLRAEHEYLLAPLPVEAAIDLFCERIQVVACFGPAQPGRALAGARAGAGPVGLGQRTARRSTCAAR
jgi:predicted ATPase